MNETTTMMSMLSEKMEGPMADMDMMMMQRCIEACSAAEQACTMCAGSMAMEGKPVVTMCMTCAEMCNTMMRMMMRPMPSSGMGMTAMMSMLGATSAMCRATAEDCMAMGDMNAAAKMCAQVCLNCADACDAMMASMKTMMPSM
ncbi:hypothetical protein N1027_19290 [Herbiconiux sp. CPCC 205763]|uniref:Aldehyde dehydrogenase n=1 Tax=Herbiconiux aconitum TaxID=2970913 RepID=A0ABT2GVV7_9MICO|nr:hypothetical protein [Herbiconiux aconitum]MCS5720276.1 hypothetical protein [Herbiconiux aconitum]